MTTAQIILSALAAASLVAVLAVCLLLVTRRLRAIADTLAQVAEAAPAGDGSTAPPDVARLNEQLESLVDELADLTERARAEST